MTALPRSLRILVPLLLLLLGGAGPVRVHAQRPVHVSVGAGWRPEVRLSGVLRDRALREALESGLPLRFHLRVELWRKDVFDHLVGSQEVSRALVRSAIEEGFALEDGRTEHRYGTLRQVEAAMEASFQVALRPTHQGRHYYLATLDVETLSLSDLDELRRWLRGEARPAVQGRKPVGSAVETGVRRFFVRLLGLPTRHYVVRSRSFAVR